MSGRQKAEKVSYDVGITGFLRLQLNWGSNVQISPDAQFGPEQNFSSPVQIRKVITPKPLIVSGRADNRWKDQKVLYNSCIWLLVRFPSEQSQLYTYYYSQSSQIRRRYQHFRLQSCWWIEHAHLPRCPSACLEFSLYLWFLHSQGGVDSSHKLKISVFLQQLCAYAWLYDLPSILFVYLSS
jgi:hypothetical protein